MNQKEKVKDYEEMSYVLRTCIGILQKSWLPRRVAIKYNRKKKQQVITDELKKKWKIMK